MPDHREGLEVQQRKEDGGGFPEAQGAPDGGDEGGNGLHCIRCIVSVCLNQREGKTQGKDSGTSSLSIWRDKTAANVPERPKRPREKMLSSTAAVPCLGICHW